MAISSTVNEPAGIRKQRVENIFYFHFEGRFPLDVISERACDIIWTHERGVHDDTK